MRFVSDDGMYFDSMEDCQKHEDKINYLKKNKEKRLKEVNAAYDKYKELINEYRKDYDEDPHFTWDDMFTKIFA